MRRADDRRLIGDAAQLNVSPLACCQTESETVR